MASTNILADLATVITNGPNSATTAAAINPNGPIMDYVGNNHTLRRNFQYMAVLLKELIQVTAAGDSANLAALTAIQNAIIGGSAPSATLITQIKAVMALAPGATTVANAIAPGGPIMDYPGNVELVYMNLEDAKNLLTKVISVTDASDSTNKTLLNGIQSGLS